MGPRWALHLSCIIASMVVKRNKSSICPPACIHGCTAKTLQAPLASCVLFCHQAGKTMPNILAFWICQFLIPLLYVLYNRLACAKVVPIFSQDILWELLVIPTILSAVLVKDGIWPFLIRTDNGLNSFYGTWPCQRKNLVSTLELVHKLDLTSKQLLLWLNNSCSISINKAKIHCGKSYRNNFAFGWVLWRKGPNFRILP